MSLRRYGPMRRSSGTRIPPAMRDAVLKRDGGCVGKKLGWPCQGGGLELHHVRASHGMGMKSPTVPENLVALDSCHRWATENGRAARPQLLAYLARLYPESVT